MRDNEATGDYGVPGDVMGDESFRLTTKVINNIYEIGEWPKYRVIHKSLRDFRTRLRATTKTDTAERSISIGRESLQVFFCTRGFGVLSGSTARG